MKETKQAKTAEPASLLEEEEEEVYPLEYNMWIENLTINVYDGGKVTFQQGRPKENPPPPGGGG